MLFDMRADEEAAFQAAQSELSELEQRLLQRPSHREPEDETRAMLRLLETQTPCSKLRLSKRWTSPG